MPIPENQLDPSCIRIDIYNTGLWQTRTDTAAGNALAQCRVAKKTYASTGADFLLLLWVQVPSLPLAHLHLEIHS